MNLFGVSQTKVQQLNRRMEALGLREKDLEEKFIRSAGPGGQNVNKVSTCVWLKHFPSGLEVKVQTERSQALNRFLARRLLTDKLEEQIRGCFSREQQRISKIRRQKRRRSRRAKDKMLAGKRLHSLKKRLRSHPPAEE